MTCSRWEKNKSKTSSVLSLSHCFWREKHHKSDLPVFWKVFWLGLNEKIITNLPNFQQSVKFKYYKCCHNPNMTRKAAAVLYSSLRRDFIQLYFSYFTPVSFISHNLIFTHILCLCLCTHIMFTDVRKSLWHRMQSH